VVVGMPEAYVEKDRYVPAWKPRPVPDDLVLLATVHVLDSLPPGTE